MKNFQMLLRLFLCRFLIILCVTVLALEMAVKIFIKPSPNCYGTFFGLELPPCNMKYYDLPEYDNSATTENDLYDKPTKIIVKGISLTNGDLYGALEEDPVTAYGNKKNYVSRNGWWQSNNLGARNRKNTSVKIPESHHRIAVFGESFTNARALPQEETYPYLLAQSLDDTEVLNFGVNGFSMGQSYLRYQLIRDKIELDTVIFVFLVCDLSRDISVSACLRKWIGCRPMPRFAVKNNLLTLIEGPYKTRKSYYRENSDEFSETFLKYLSEYDRYYMPEMHGQSYIYLKSDLFKFITAIVFNQRIKRLNAHLIHPESEAFLITKNIFKNINRETQQRGQNFYLVFLPTQSDVIKYKKDGLFQAQWDTMVPSMCESNIKCIDLMKPFTNLKLDQFDTAYNGGHYGPRMNQIIAKEISKYLR